MPNSSGWSRRPEASEPCTGFLTDTFFVGFPNTWILTTSWPRTVSSVLVAPFLVCITFRFTGWVDFPDKLVDPASFYEYFLYLQYTHTLTIITISNKSDPIPPLTACNQDWFPFDSGIMLMWTILDFRSFMGIPGSGLSFFKFTSWWLDRFCKPNDFQMQKFTGMNLGTCIFAI